MQQLSQYVTKVLGAASLTVQVPLVGAVPSTREALVQLPNGVAGLKTAHLSELNVGVPIGYKVSAAFGNIRDFRVLVEPEAKQYFTLVYLDFNYKLWVVINKVMPDKTIQEGLPTQLFGDWATIANFQAAFVMGAPGVLSVASNNIAVANAGRLATYIVSYDTQSVNIVSTVTLPEGLDSAGYASGLITFTRGFNELDVIMTYGHSHPNMIFWSTNALYSISDIGNIVPIEVTPLDLRTKIIATPAVNIKYPEEDPSIIRCAVYNDSPSSYYLTIGVDRNTAFLSSSNGNEIDSLVIKLDSSTYLQGYVNTVSGMIFTLRLISIERMNYLDPGASIKALLRYSTTLLYPFASTEIEALSGTQMSKVPGSSNKIILAGFRLNGTGTNRDLVAITGYINKATGIIEFSPTRVIMENVTNTSGIISLEYLPSNTNEAVVCWAPAEDSTLADRGTRCFTIVTGLDYSALLGVVSPLGAPAGYISMNSLGSSTPGTAGLLQGVCYIDPDTHLPSSEQSSKVLGIYDKINNNLLLKELSYD